MKTRTRLAISLTVAAMAIGFSAFTNEKNSDATYATATFFNTTGVASTDPDDYVYRPNGGCIPSAEACSATWNYTGTLTEGSHPNGSKVSTTDNAGTYNGN